MYNNTMTQGFFQFNSSIINEILNFVISTFDLLYMDGPKGSAKSETIGKIIPQLEEENLVFQQFCFENSVIDDFLLNFYDALRNFSLAQKISLKKFTEGNFKEKVSHYFKTINANCVIIVENFEKVEKNNEIIDFLSHLASYENVKIIIVSRNTGANVFRFKKIRVKTIKIEQIDESEFKSKLSVLSEDIDDDLKDKFYNITQGLELYLKMAVKYSSVTGILIRDLISEFERKNVSLKVGFEEFMVSKFVSLTPSAYQDLFKILCTLSHPVSVDFLKEYKLGDTSHIEYLSKNFLISHFKNEIYVKDYFKQYIVKTFSIQEKITYYKNLVEIYENELTKSPKDRLLRLSRESIRKEIELFNSLIPAINSPEKSQKTFSYLGIASSSWHDEKLHQKTKLSEKLNKIKERKKFLTKEENDLLIKKRLEDSGQKSLVDENKEKNRLFIINLINSAREFSKNYKYQDSLSELKRAYEVDFEGEFRIEILTLVAKNHECLNEYKIAKQFYENALDIALKNGDSRVCELEYFIANCFKNLYRIDDAKERYKAIAQNENNSKSYRTRAYIEIAQIDEADSKIHDAIKHYEKALSISLGKNKELTAKIYYKLGVLYDENQDIENAIKYYRKNYTISSERNENKYYSASLTNLALINIDLENYKEAIDFLKLALLYDSEVNDYENMYFSQKELAKLYAKFDEVIAIGYFKQALSSAQKLNDDFKIALVYFEAGEFHYDRGNDEKALINFLSAKASLKNGSNDENIARINQRIKDIKMRLDDVSYNLIIEKYDKQQRN